MVYTYCTMQAWFSILIFWVVLHISMQKILLFVVFCIYTAFRRKNCLIFRCRVLADRYTQAQTQIKQTVVYIYSYIHTSRPPAPPTKRIINTYIHYTPPHHTKQTLLASIHNTTQTTNTTTRARERATNHANSNSI